MRMRLLFRVALSISITLAQENFRVEPHAASLAITFRVATALVMHGDKDNLAPLSQSELLHAGLKQAGVDSTFFIGKSAGHGFRNRLDLDPVANEFFAKHLKPGGDGDKNVNFVPKIESTFPRITSTTKDLYL